MEKREALAKFLDIAELGDCMEKDCNEFTAKGQDYLVLTDEEADAKAREEIESLLWAFNAKFVAYYVPGYAEWDMKQTDAFIACLQAMQEKLCEDANCIIAGFVGDKIDRFVSDAIIADGRGHFLSHYDGEENEEGEYFIYRV